MIINGFDASSDPIGKFDCRTITLWINADLMDRISNAS